MPDPNSEYKFYATISVGGNKIENVLCKIKLPETNDGDINLTLHSESRIERIFKFSLYGEIVGFNDEIEMSFHADTVYNVNATRTHISKDISEVIVKADPIDLSIIRYFSNSNESDEISSIVYKLTPCHLFNIPHILETSFTGNVNVKRLRTPTFQIANGINVTFDYHYQHINHNSEKTISFKELIAESKDCTVQTEANVFSEIDDFLMLASFAARRKCICVGYDLHKSNSIKSYYRRDRAIPKYNNHDSMDVVIDIPEFENFMKTTYQFFCNSEDKNLLRTAIYGIPKDINTITEKEFLKTYSVIETLVLIHRNTNNLNTVLDDTEWKVFNAELEDFIKNNSSLSTDQKKISRKKIYEKLPELNRVSFNDAYYSLCKSLNMDVSDLWPLCNSEDGVSLTKIRHTLVHGGSLEQEVNQTLISAYQNLRWIAERLILSILEWDYNKSQVSKASLRNMTSYNEWQNDRAMLTSSFSN